MALAYLSGHNTMRVDAGVPLPLERVAALRGGDAHGPGGIGFLATDDGVYVSRKGALSFFAPGLGEELWRKNTSAWVVQLSLGCDIVYGPAQGVVRRYDAAGKVVAEVHASGLLQAVDEACVVAWVDGELVATEWSGRVRWRRKTLASHVLLDGERTFVVENLGCRLVCLESASGAERWELKAPENRRQPTGWFLSGFPSVAIARGELVVIGRDGSVQLVDRASGEVRAMTMPPYVGSFLVSETAVYFFRLAGWSQLDLATLSETARQEYVADVAHMQGRVLPAAFWISEESVFWTTLGGQVMGVSRFADEGGRRVWWSDEVRGILAIAEPPVHVGRHLYVRTRGSQGSAGELICYKSV